MQATLAGLGEHNTHRITDDDDEDDDDDADSDDDDDHDGDDIYCDAKLLMMMIVWIIPCVIMMAPMVIMDVHDYAHDYDRSAGTGIAL